MKVVMKGVSVDVDRIPVLHDITMTAASGAFVGIVGPNGAGKSTLLKTIYRVTKPRIGEVWVGGRQVWDMHQRETARRIAVLHQVDHADFDFTVEEVVGLGRLPHRRIGAAPSSRDRHLIEAAIQRCSIGHLRHRFLLSLSGGERQRVLIARAIAQEPEVLVLDEPSNHLDISSQLELLDLISELDVTVLAALHDLNLALAYCDDIVVLTSGRVTAAGPTAEVLTESLVSEVYGISSWRGVHPGTGRLQLSFARSQEMAAGPHLINQTRRT